MNGRVTLRTALGLAIALVSIIMAVVGIRVGTNDPKGLGSMSRQRSQSEERIGIPQPDQSGRESTRESSRRQEGGSPHAALEEGTIPAQRLAKLDICVISNQGRRPLAGIVVRVRPIARGTFGLHGPR